MSSRVCPSCHESCLTAIERIRSYSMFYVSNDMVEWTGDHEVIFDDAVVTAIECDNCDWSVEVGEGEDLVGYLAPAQEQADEEVEVIEDVPDTDF